jgi:hypothetical protein
MTPNLVLIAAMWCTLFASSQASADDKPQPEPKKLVLLRLTVKDAAEAATELNRFGYMQVMRVPLFNALVARCTDEELAAIRTLLRPG